MSSKRARIGLKEVRGLALGETVWDTAVSGFCARRRQTDAVYYGLKHRTKDGRQRWLTIGRHGAPWTPDMARDEAVRLLGEVVKGGDPAAEKKDHRKATTVAELCDAYIEAAEAGRLLTRHGATKKASTLQIDKGRITQHIKPLLGRHLVASITSDDVESFMHAVADGKTAKTVKTGKHGLARVVGGQGTAARTVGLLGGIFTFAIRRKIRSDNPVRGVTRYADGKRERRLTDAEYKNIGTTLRQLEGTIWPPAIALAQFLTLTGWRRGEAINLKWNELDLSMRTARLTECASDTHSHASRRQKPYRHCKME